MKKNNVTIKDVAQHAKVGLGTASRAINGRSGVSDKTREKVYKAIDELGYIPDKTAQNMRTTRYKKIGFMMDITNIAFSNIAKSLQDQLNSLGYELSICDVGYVEPLKKMKGYINGNKLDGLIVSLPSEDDSEANKFLAELSFPVVALDRKIESVTGIIQTDYFTSVKKATNYLLSLGHRKIALIGVTSKIRPTKVSIEAFKSAFDEQGIEQENMLIMEGSFTLESGEKIMQELLPKIEKREITAILSLNNRLFLGMLKVIRTNSLSYPKDISIITVEDDELTELLDPPITVIKRNLNEMGRNAANLVVGLVEKNQSYIEQSIIIIPTEFIIRKSCEYHFEDFVSGIILNETGMKDESSY